MSALWWIGLTLALLGALMPYHRESQARRLALTGVALLTLNALHHLIGA
jgi:hypothetical protein